MIRPLKKVTAEMWYNQVLLAYTYADEPTRLEVLFLTDVNRSTMEQSTEWRMLWELYPSIATALNADLAQLYEGRDMPVPEATILLLQRQAQGRQLEEAGPSAGGSGLAGGSGSGMGAEDAPGPSSAEGAAAAAERVGQQLGRAEDQEAELPIELVLRERIFYLSAELAFGHNVLDIQNGVADQMFDRADTLFTSRGWGDFLARFPSIAQRAVQYMNRRHGTQHQGGVIDPIGDDPAQPQHAPTSTDTGSSSRRRDTTSSQPHQMPGDLPASFSVSLMLQQSARVDKKEKTKMAVRDFASSLPPGRERNETIRVGSASVFNMDNRERESLRRRWVGVRRLAIVQRPRDVADLEAERERIRAWMTREHVTVIMTDGRETPRIAWTFVDALFPIAVERALRSNLPGPTPVQSAVWPQTNAGRDVIIMAPGAAGKTLAYLLPAVARVARMHANRRARQGPLAIIIEPTVELAVQVADILAGFVAGSHLHVGVHFSGPEKYDQWLEIQGNWTDIVVVTPMRLVDMLQARRMQLDQVVYVAIDEADRVLDQYDVQMNMIYGVTRRFHLPTTTQTVLASATWPAALFDRAAEHILRPGAVLVQVGQYGWDWDASRPGRSVVPNLLVEQNFIVVKDEMNRAQRMGQVLRHLLRQYEPTGATTWLQSVLSLPKTVIFCSDRTSVHELATQLRNETRARIVVVDRHAKPGPRRAQLNEFIHNASVTIMVTSFYMGRGLDMPEVGIVILYDMPNTLDEYVQMIGRTGRQGQTGLSYAFIHAWLDRHLLQPLVEMLRLAGQYVPPLLQRAADAEEPGFAGEPPVEGRVQVAMTRQEYALHRAHLTRMARRARELRYANLDEPDDTPPVPEGDEPPTVPEATPPAQQPPPEQQPPPQPQQQQAEEEDDDDEEETEEKQPDAEPARKPYKDWDADGNGNGNAGGQGVPKNEQQQQQ